MIDTRAQREERNRLVAEAQALIPKNGAMTPEAEAKFEQIMADADKLKATIERAERASALEAELRAAQPIEHSAHSSVAPQQTEKEEKRAKAFSKMLRVGLTGLNAEEIAEVRTLGVSTGSQGAYTVPSGFQKELEVALKWFGGIREVARVIKTSTGNPLPWPNANDTANAGRRLSTGAVSEKDMSFGVVNFGAFTYTTDQIAVANELLQDTAFDLEAFIREEFVTRIGRIQNSEFTTYANADGPQGVLPFAIAGGATVTGTAGETAAVTFDNLQDLIHKVDLAYRKNGKFMFNDATLSALRKLKDNYGRYLWEPGVDGAKADKIWGYEYVVNNDVPVMAASANSILFGDFSKYVIRDIDGIQIKRLNEIGATSNQTVFVGFIRSDARGLDAGTHPLAVYTNSAT